MKEGSSNNSGLASLIFGTLSVLSIFLILFAFLAPIPGFIMGILAIAFAISQNKKEKNKWSKWGLILGIIGLVLNALLLFFILSAVAGFVTSYFELCNQAGGCENVASYIQSQQIQALTDNALTQQNGIGY